MPQAKKISLVSDVRGASRLVIDLTLLNAEEILWLDTYHARVERALSPLVDAATKPWLEIATRPLIRS